MNPDCFGAAYGSNAYKMFALDYEYLEKRLLSALAIPEEAFKDKPKKKRKHSLLVLGRRKVKF